MTKFLPIISFFFIAITFSNPTFSQDAKAKEILEKLSSTVKNAGSLSADFTLVIKMPNGKVKETKKGKFNSKNSAFKVQLGENEVFCDSKTIWNYNKKSKEVQVNDYDPNETTMSPEKLFSNSYDKDFTYEYEGFAPVNGVKFHIIKLTPKNKRSQFSKIEIFIDPKDNLVKHGLITDKSGNTYIYHLDKVVLSKTLPASFFIFNPIKFPGVKTVDLR